MKRTLLVIEQWKLSSQGVAAQFNACPPQLAAQPVRWDAVPYFVPVFVDAIDFRTDSELDQLNKFVWILAYEFTQQRGWNRKFHGEEI